MARQQLKLIGLLALVLPISVVQAGARSTVEVTIELDEAGVNPISAQGNIADAYNSSDQNQFIGCGGNAFTGWCQAHDATADADGVVNSAFCFTQNPDLIAHIRSIAADSFVFFTIDPTTAECAVISASHQSFYRPKAP